MSDSQNDAPNVELASGQPAEKPEGTSRGEGNFIVRRAAGHTRFIATVPAIGLFVAAIVLAIGTLVGLIYSSYEFIVGEISLHEIAIAYVEDADLFLLAVALYILSIGLMNLFVAEEIELPKWLEFRDFDDLKERLTSVIIVMIGVYFLGYVLKGPNGIDTLWIGLGCGAVVIALSFFVRSVFKSHE